MLELKAPHRAGNRALHAIGTYLFFEIYCFIVQSRSMSTTVQNTNKMLNDREIK